jgi:hypothetical protein
VWSGQSCDTTLPCTIQPLLLQDPSSSAQRTHSFSTSGTEAHLLRKSTHPMACSIIICNIISGAQTAVSLSWRRSSSMQLEAIMSRVQDRCKTDAVSFISPSASSRSPRLVSSLSTASNELFFSAEVDPPRCAHSIERRTPLQLRHLPINDFSSPTQFLQATSSCCRSFRLIPLLGTDAREKHEAQVPAAAPPCDDRCAHPIPVHWKLLHPSLPSLLLLIRSHCALSFPHLLPILTDGALVPLLLHRRGLFLHVVR